MLKSDIDNIVKLKFISCIQKDQKIDVTLLRVYPNNLFTSVSRTLKGTNTRESTVTFIKNTISNAFDIIYTYLESEKVSEKEQVHSIIEDLAKTKISLENLQFTYSDDVMFVCKLKTFNQIIDSKLKELKTMYPNECGEFISSLLSHKNDM